MSLGKKMNLKPYKVPHYPLSDLCPWDIMLDGGEEGDGICLLKGNALLCAYEFIAPDRASSAASRIASVSQMFNAAIMQLGDGWTVQFELQRKYSDAYPVSRFSSLTGYMVEESRRRSFEGGKLHFENRYFLSFTYRLPGAMESKGAAAFLAKKDANKEDTDMEALAGQVREFIMTCEKAVGVLNSVMDVKRLDNDGLFTLLHSSVSTNWDNRKYSDDWKLFVDTGATDDDLENSMPLKLGQMYIPIIAICSFPSRTIPAMFDILNRVDVPLRWSTRFECLNREKAEKQVELTEKHWRGNRKSIMQKVIETMFHTETENENSAAYALEADAQEARAELYMGNACYGNYTSNIMLMNPDLKIAEDSARYIMGVISSTGFSCKEETFNALPAFLSMMPGNIYANTRTCFCSSSNVSHVVPVSSIWAGMKDNVFLGEISGNSHPLLTCQTEYGIPFFLNLNVKDVGHTWISGPTGAGKSTLLALLEAQWLKYPGARVIIFDKDRSARSLTVCVGGTYIEPGKDDTAFQPLSDIDTPEGVRWACEFVAALLSEQKIEVTPRMRKAIYEAMNEMGTKEMERRTLSSFVQYCHYTDINTGNNDIVDGLSPYVLTGTFGQLFDADNANVPIRDWTMIEMGTLMNMSDAVTVPALLYLFHECEKKFDGKPTLLILDEAWVFLKNKQFSAKIVEWLKTLRKKNVFVVFATQEVADAANSPIATTIISQCASQIFLPDERAATRALFDSYRKFGLEDSEISLLANPGEMIKKRDYFYKSTSGTRIFQLDLDPLQLGILTTSSDDHKRLDVVEQKFGKNTGRELVREVLSIKKIPFKAYLPKRKTIDKGREVWQ